MNERLGEEQERWLANETAAERSREFEREALADADLAEEAYAALAVQDALRVAAARPRLLLAPRRLAWTASLLAAVLAFVLLLPKTHDPEGDYSLRLRNAGDAGAAVGVEPAGEVGRFPRVFKWHPAVADGDISYRWELYDGQAHRRAVAVVADTFVVRPASETPADSVGVWRWLVVKLQPDSQEGATSAAVEFTVKVGGQ